MIRSRQRGILFLPPKLAIVSSQAVAGAVSRFQRLWKGMQLRPPNSDHGLWLKKENISIETSAFP
jgi:hypothetical protein